MAKYTADEPGSIKKAVARWIKDSDAKIPIIISLGYGWEGWVQADLGYYLALETQTNDAILRREERPYPDNRRVDLAIIGPDGKTWHYFEIKCKSANETKRTFLDGLMADYGKMEEIVVDKLQARCWVFGFWIDDNEGKPGNFTDWQFDRINGINILHRTQYGFKPKVKGAML